MKNPWLVALLIAGLAVLALGLILLAGPMPLFGIFLTLLGGVAIVGWLVGAAVTWNQNRGPHSS